MYPSDLLCHGSLEELKGVRCGACNHSLSVWYSWMHKALNVRCSPDCGEAWIDGVLTPPPWAEPEAETTIETLSGRREVKPIREPSLDEIDAQRGVMRAVLRPDNWTKCPFCGKQFATYSRTSWNNQRHVSCQTKLELVDSDSTAVT